MTEIDCYLEEKHCTKEIEKLTAWRDFYLQDQITWETIKDAQDRRDAGEDIRIDIPIVNLAEAVRVNYKIDKYRQRIDRL